MVRYHIMIINDFDLLIRPRNFLVVLFLLELAHVVGNGTRPFFASLDVNCLIVTLW